MGGMQQGQRLPAGSISAGCRPVIRYSPPATVTDVAGLISWLRERGGGYAEALADLSVVRVAVNQEYVAMSHPVARDDEIALFPPVTGG